MKIWSAELKELEVLHSSLKDHFADFEKEMERFINADDENMVLLYSRRCLEVIITDLCECELKRPRKTEPLKGIIDKLNQEEKVPAHIIASMQSLNSLSTFGAHPKEYEPEQVKPVLNNLSTILKWYLKYKTEKAEVEERYKVQGPGYRVEGTGYKVQVTKHKFQVLESQDDRPAEIDTNLKGTKAPPHIPTSGTKPFMIVSGILGVAIILYFVLDHFNFFRKDKFED